MTIIQPLDFRTVIMDHLIGGGTLGAIIFAILGMLIITIMAARFRMPGGAYVMMIVTFIIVFSSVTFLAEGTTRFLIAIIATGISLVFARAIGRIFN